MRISEIIYALEVSCSGVKTMVHLYQPCTLLMDVRAVMHQACGCKGRLQWPACEQPFFLYIDHLYATTPGPVLIIYGDGSIALLVLCGCSAQDDSKQA